ncbi:hypothetical protein FIBSPDRAFT_1054011 [Athelia psychrophila]|uniref:Uncharacterized protein n=1 Tax=Athelia psychrophila TaxID=1759441 RepID=A0A167W141_9AGAM|nr:hypothetical protein FIBSPDRAFT_1054011 [Fibularhizoctonia sp. CBS 109695]
MNKVIIDWQALTPNGTGSPAIPPRRSNYSPLILWAPSRAMSSRKNMFDLLDRYEIITGNAAEAKTAFGQIVKL